VPDRRSCSRKYLRAGDNEQQFCQYSLVLIRNHDRRRHENQATKGGGSRTSVNRVHLRSLSSMLFVRRYLHELARMAVACVHSQLLQTATRSRRDTPYWRFELANESKTANPSRATKTHTRGSSLAIVRTRQFVAYLRKPKIRKP